MLSIRHFRILAVVAAVALACQFVLAVSGGQIAIGRAFQYGYNNPMPSPGQGPLASSVYSSNSFDVPVSRGGGGGQPPNPMMSPLSSSMRSNQVYTPMAPLTVTGGGGGARLAPTPGASFSPMRDVTSALSDKEQQDRSIHEAWLKSLAPEIPEQVRLPMLQGEYQFRQKRYDLAAENFEAARKAGNDSAETLLSLFHTNFARGPETFNQASHQLAVAIKKFPELPQVRVRPQEFYGNIEDYRKDFASLQQYSKANPKDASALMLLGYLQWREGLVDQAVTSLDAAMALSPDNQLQEGIVLLLEGMNRLRKMVLAKAPPLEPARDYPWAGVRIAMPQGFRSEPLKSLNQVVTGMASGDEAKSPQLVSLYAYPLSADVTLEAFMDSVSQSMSQQKFIRDLTTDSQLEVPFMKGKALVRLLTYSDVSSGSRIAMGWVAFFRPGGDSTQPRVGYLLSLAKGETPTEGVLPALAAVAKSLSLVPFAQPAEDIKGYQVQDVQMRFAITQPATWAGRQTDRGYEMGQMLFSHGNDVSPKVEIIVQDVPASYTAQSLGQEAIKRNAEVDRQVLSSQPATLAGQQGYQFVIQQTPRGQKAAQPVTLVGRLILLEKSPEKKTLYALVVQSSTASVQEVERLTDQLASAFQLLSQSPAGEQKAAPEEASNNR